VIHLTFITLYTALCQSISIIFRYSYFFFYINFVLNNILFLIKIFSWNTKRVYQFNSCSNAYQKKKKNTHNKKKKKPKKKKKKTKKIKINKRKKWKKKIEENQCLSGIFRRRINFAMFFRFICRHEFRIRWKRSKP